MGDTILVVNVYAPSERNQRENFFEMLRHQLQGYDGLIFMGGDFNCTLVPHLDRSFVSRPGRHDSIALRRLLGRAQLSDVLDDDMEQAEDERAIAHFHAKAHTYFTHCQEVDRPTPGSIAGMSVLDTRTGFAMSNFRYPVLQLTTMA